jgi:hypothetical protein
VFAYVLIWPNKKLVPLLCVCMDTIYFLILIFDVILCLRIANPIRFDCHCLDGSPLFTQLLFARFRPCHYLDSPIPLIWMADSTACSINSLCDGNKSSTGGSTGSGDGLLNSCSCRPLSSADRSFSTASGWFCCSCNPCTPIAASTAWSSTCSSAACSM